MLRILGWFIVLLGLMSPAYADGVRVDSSFPGGLRYIAPYSTNSDCIGSTETARCTIETQMACFARADKDACAAAGAKISEGAKELYVSVFEYVAAEVFRHNDEKPENLLPNGRRPLRMLVEVVDHNLNADNYEYHLIERENGWEIEVGVMVGMFEGPFDFEVVELQQIPIINSCEK